MRLSALAALRRDREQSVIKMVTVTAETSRRTRAAATKAAAVGQCGAGFEPIPACQAKKAQRWCACA
jgi:hypothetical protein